MQPGTRRVNLTRGFGTNGYASKFTNTGNTDIEPPIEQQYESYSFKTNGGVEPSAIIYIHVISWPANLLIFSH